MVKNKISGRWIGVLAMVAVGVLVGGGCSSGGATPPTDGVDTTVIRVGPDGKLHTYHYVASPEQYARELAAKKAFLNHETAPQPDPGTSVTGSGEDVSQQSAAISVVTCAGGDLWVYDQSGCPGSGSARICFNGSGTANLDNQGFYICGGSCFYVYWDANVYSFSPGSEVGYFENNAWGTQVSFSANQGCTNTNLCNPGGDCDTLVLTD